jgi:hypothetical protein
VGANGNFVGQNLQFAPGFPGEWFISPWPQ